MSQHHLVRWGLLLTGVHWSVCIAEKVSPTAGARSQTLCTTVSQTHQRLHLLSAKHTKDYTFCQPNTPKITPSVSQTCQRLQLVSQTHQRLHFLSAKHTKDDNLCWPQRLQLLSAKHAKAYDSCQPNTPKITTSVSQTCQKITASVSQTHQRLQLILATEITTSVSQTCQRLQLLSTNHHITSTFNQTSHYNFCQPDTTLLLLSKHHVTTSEHSVVFIVFLPHM